MKPEEQFFGDKSVLEQKLIDFIKLCHEIERDPCEEVSEAVWNAFSETGSEFDVTIS